LFQDALTILPVRSYIWWLKSRSAIPRIYYHSLIEVLDIKWL